METMIHPETGETLRRDVRRQKVEYHGQVVIIDAPGWYPEGDGDGVICGPDGKIWDRALHLMKAREAGLLSPSEIRTVRRKLGLTQVEAGEVLGGGPRAFQKYEAGDIMLSVGMDSVLRLLDRDPELLVPLRTHRALYSGPPTRLEDGSHRGASEDDLLPPAKVSPHSERVVTDCVPDEAAAPPQLADFIDQTVEMIAIDEQVTGLRTLRIVEEVALRKEGVDHVETVRDTIRRKEVPIVPGQGGSAGEAKGAGLPGRDH